MESILNTIFATIEKDNDITIIFACESGSRNWGLHSKESDYDIRYVYVHNSIFWYTSTDKKKDTINNTFPEHVKIEMSGWDLVKSIKELKVSNPSIIEWIQSSCVYINRNKFQETISGVINQLHNNKSLMLHYNRMLCSNLKFFNTETVLRKKYFYILMPALNLTYLRENNTCIICPDFETLLNSCTVPNDVKLCILELIKDKREGKCYNTEPKIPLLDNWTVGVKTLVEDELHTKEYKNDINIKSGAPGYHILSKQHFADMMKCISDSGGVIKRVVFLNMICDLMRTISLIANKSLTKRDINCKIKDLFQYCPDTLLPNDINHEIQAIIEGNNDTANISFTLREWYRITINNFKPEINYIDNMNRNLREHTKKAIYEGTLSNIDPGIFEELIKTFMKSIQIEWNTPEMVPNTCDK